MIGGALERVIRLVPPPDAVSSEYDAAAQRGVAVRMFGPRFAYASYRNADGVSMVARYPLPEGCATQRRSRRWRAAVGLVPGLVASAFRPAGG